jgi:hypothetical protein
MGCPATDRLYDERRQFQHVIGCLLFCAAELDTRGFPSAARDLHRLLKQLQATAVLGSLTSTRRALKFTLFN